LENREERRHPESAGRERPPHEKVPPRSDELERQGPPDTQNPRAKSSGHGKKTADKWNQ
jgi:hypothetical protein